MFCITSGDNVGSFFSDVDSDPQCAALLSNPPHTHRCQGALGIFAKDMDEDSNNNKAISSDYAHICRVCSVSHRISMFRRNTYTLRSDNWFRRTKADAMS